MHTTSTALVCSKKIYGDITHNFTLFHIKNYSHNFQDSSRFAPNRVDVGGDLASGVPQETSTKPTHRVRRRRRSRERCAHRSIASTSARANHNSHSGIWEHPRANPRASKGEHTTLARKGFPCLPAPLPSAFGVFYLGLS